MPPETSEPGSPDDWLGHARSDLTVASQPLAEGVLPSTLCFHTQQAVEKAIKAVLLARDVSFPHTHSIARLITLLQEAGIEWPEDLSDAAELTRYAARLRYPGTPAPATSEDLVSALEIAREVLAWAEQVVRAEPGDCSSR